jgi:hypothetical protein
VLQRKVPHRGGAGGVQGEHAAPNPELRGGGRGGLHVHIHQLTWQDRGQHPALPDRYTVHRQSERMIVRFFSSHFKGFASCGDTIGSWCAQSTLVHPCNTSPIHSHPNPHGAKFCNFDSFYAIHKGGRSANKSRKSQRHKFPEFNNMLDSRTFRNCLRSQPFLFVDL